MSAGWTSFLHDWPASGCFGSHSFDLDWSWIEKLVPRKVLPVQNGWVSAYKAKFPSL